MAIEPGRVRWWIVGGLLAVAALAACSGDDDDADSPVDAGADTPAATATATEPAAPAVEIRAESALDSYRYEVTIELSGIPVGGAILPQVSDELLIEISGAVIAPDRQQMRLRVDLGGQALDIETITIGDMLWSRNAGGEWVDGGSPLLAIVAGELDIVSNPGRLFAFDGSEGPALADLQQRIDTGALPREQVNGVETLRLDLTGDDFAGLFAATSLLPPDASETAAVTLWIAVDGGYPVRLLVEASGGEGDDEAGIRIDFKLSEFNSGTISIEPPA